MCDNDGVGYDGTVLNVDSTPLSMNHNERIFAYFNVEPSKNEINCAPFRRYSQEGILRLLNPIFHLIR